VNCMYKRIVRERLLVINLLLALMFVARLCSAQTARKDDATERKIKVIVAEQLGVAEGKVVPNARLREDLKADDLDLVELVMAIEEGFDIEISDQECAHWKTVADIVRTVRPKVKDAKPKR
jgi:acyl carrier protein